MEVEAEPEVEAEVEVEAEAEVGVEVEAALLSLTPEAPPTVGAAAQRRAEPDGGHLCQVHLQLSENNDTIWTRSGFTLISSQTCVN